VKSNLKILYLEDDPKDADLVLAMLEAEGVTCRVTLVETKAGFVAGLDQEGLDLILADYSLPTFDGISALEIAAEKRPEVPFIFVSGAMGEEVAIEALKIGATDYVLKTRLSRISLAVQRALREGQARVERASAEEALRRSEAYLAEGQRLSHTGSFGWNVQSGDNYWSDETYRIFEFDRATRANVSLVFERVHPDDAEAVRKIIEQAARDGKDFEHQYRLLMPNGSVKHVHVVAHALVGGSAGLEFTGAVMDETAAKQAEEALRLSEEQWRDVFENNPIMYFMVDAAGTIMAVNSFGAEQLGCSVDELLGRPVLQVFYGADREAVKAALAACLEQIGRGGSWEFRCVRKNSTVLRVRGSAKAVARVNGPILLIACEDITEQRRAEEALFQAGLEARVSERVRIAREVHDTVLQSFHGLILRFQVARDMLPLQPEEAMQALDGALNMADEAITESREAIQDLRSEPTEPVDLAHLLTAIGEELAESQDLDPPTFSITVEGDRRALVPVLQDEIYRIGRELLRNAFRHSGARHVDAEILFDEQLLRLRIRDDGRGIDPQVLEDGGRAGHWGLIGIRERARRMTAQLDFWSEAGVGTEVQLTLPASVAYERPAANLNFGEPDGGLR
jgi:PAS domain S-box-containing protein